MIFVIVGLIDSFGVCIMCKMCKMCRCFRKCAKCAKSINFRSKIPSRVLETVRFEEHRYFFQNLNKISVVAVFRLPTSLSRQKSRRAEDLRKLHILHIFAHFAHFCTFFTFGSLRRLLGLRVCGFAWMVLVVSVFWDLEM